MILSPAVIELQRIFRPVKGLASGVDVQQADAAGSFLVLRFRSKGGGFEDEGTVVDLDKRAQAKIMTPPFDSFTKIEKLKKSF